MDWHVRVRNELPEITGDFRRDAEIQDELADHCVARHAELIATGVFEAEADTRVLDELRATARQRRALGRRGDDPRGVASLATGSPARAWLSHGWQDVRYAVRLLLRTPGATMASVLTLALTIGATTAIFSVVQAVLLQPLPYPEADRLVRVWEASPQSVARNVVSAGNYLAWTDRAQSFNALGAFRIGFDAALTAPDGPPEKLSASSMTASVLDVVSVAPAIGPGLSPGTLASGGSSEILISWGLWHRRFGGDPGAIGRGLTLDGRPFTVVGVMPSGFRFPVPDIDVWFAHRFDADDRTSFTSHNYNVIGRLAPGVSLAQAQAEMTSIAGVLATEQPADMTGWGVNVVPAHADAVRTVRPLLLMLMGVVVIVLLIACANLATLQLARASRRQLEMAVRSAIGAGRYRLVRQLLAESLVVAIAGGILGVAVLSVSLQALVVAAPADIPFLDTIAINGTVLGFTVLVTMVCALLVGLVPAALMSRTDVRSLLSSSRGHAGGSATRLRHVLVAAQIGLALVLLVSAGLLVQSFWNLRSVDHGFDPRQLLAVSIDLPQSRYPDNDRQLSFYRDLGERLSTTPGVVRAAGTTATPARGAGMTFSFAIEGRVAPNPSGRENPVPLQGITPGYFETMRIPILEGRSIEHADRVDAPGALVINETLAKLHWPSGGAVGARIRFRDNHPWFEIVGVVGDTHDEGLDVAPPPTVYVSLAQRHASWSWMTWQTLMIRTAGDPMELLPSVRDTIWAFDKDLPLLEVATVESAFAENDARRRFTTQLFAAFALLALGLGAVGVFGVLSCAMVERRREIGIRLALGAEPGRVAGAMIRSALVWAMGGIALGALVAVLVTRYLQTLLFNVEASDPATFVAMTTLLVMVAALSAWVPARRAARLSPLTALRQD
jgi:putative ABC transport system permease protein